MPYENGAWRPLSADEVEHAAATVQLLTDASTEAPEDSTHDFQKEVLAQLSDPKGYNWHEARKIADRLLLDHFLNDAPIKYYRVFHYAADVTRQQGLRRLESTEWPKSLPAILRAMSYLTEEQAIEAARDSLAKLAAQADAAKRLRERGFALDVRGGDLLMTPDEYERLRSVVINEAIARGGSSLFGYMVSALEACWSNDFFRRC